jgi:gamma-glutamylcyclotransferase (GGCT)/AIG2-like uncharacterized protein YtfP
LRPFIVAAGRAGKGAFAQVSAEHGKVKNENLVENPEGVRLFVYGTLRKGFRSHGWLSRLHARFLATGHVRGRLYDLGEFPGAVESSEHRERLYGEVYLLPNAVQAFGILDKFEGFDPAKPKVNLFERKRTTVELAGGREMQAWIYWLVNARQSGRRVASGNYAKCQA